MTISSTDRVAGPYTGTGLVTTYPFAFKVFRPVDLVVVRTDTADVESTLVLNVDYTVALNANQNTDPGGNIVLAAALPVDYVLLITSDMAALQETDLTNAGGFYPTVINNALDRLTILVQEDRRDLSRSIKAPLGVTGEEYKEQFDLDVAQVAADRAAADAASTAASAAQGAAETARNAAQAASTTAQATVSGTVRYDQAQSKTTGEQNQARANTRSMSRNMDDVQWPAILRYGTVSAELEAKAAGAFNGTLTLMTGLVGSPGAYGVRHNIASLCENAIPDGTLAFPVANSAIMMVKQSPGVGFGYYAEAHAFGARSSALAAEFDAYNRTMLDCNQSPRHLTDGSSLYPIPKGLSIGGTGSFKVGTSGETFAVTTLYETIRNGDVNFQAGSAGYASAAAYNGFVVRPGTVTQFGFYSGATSTSGPTYAAWFESSGAAGAVGLTLFNRGAKTAGRNIFEYKADGTAIANETDDVSQILSGTVYTALDLNGRLKIGDQANASGAHVARLVVSGNDTVTSGSRSVPNANAVLGLTSRPADTSFGATFVFSVATGNTPTLTPLGAVGLAADLVLQGCTTTAIYEAMRVRGAYQAVKLAVRLEAATATVATLPSTDLAAGQSLYCTNMRVFNGTGTFEGPGAGTGGTAEYNGTAWKIAGTNVNAQA